MLHLYNERDYLFGIVLTIEAIIYNRGKILRKNTHNR